MYYFPYTNFHDINLDWLIEYVKSTKSEIEDLINHFENLIVQTTGDSTNKVMSQNAVTAQLNYLSSRINTLNTTVEELTAKLNEDIANLAEFETETDSNFSSDRNRLSTIENALTRFYVFVKHTETETTINVSMSDLLKYRTRANVRYYISDSVNNFVRCAYESYSPQSPIIMLQTLPFTVENAVYRATIYTASGGITYDKIGLIAITQSSGTSQTAVMSQRAVTEFINNSILYVKFTITADTSRCNYSFETIRTYITNKQFVYGDVTFVEKNTRYYCSVYSVSSERICFRAIPSYDSSQSLTVVLNYNDEVSYTQPNLGVLPYYPRYVISSDGETISGNQLALLHNIFNAIVVNNYSPQIYLKITTDNVIEQLYVDSANSTGYVLRNNNYIITYTTTPSVTIEPVDKIVKVTVTEKSNKTFTADYTYDEIINLIDARALIYCVVKITDQHYEYYMLTRRIPNNIYFAEVYTTSSSFYNKQLIININNIVQITELPASATFTLMSDGETVPSSQLSTLQNILNAITVNSKHPQIYLNITTDNVIEQLYVDSANSTGYVLRNNNYIITYTTTPSVTIEAVEKVFTSSSTGITRIAAGGATGYSILKISGDDIDLTNYYIVDADITNLIGGVSTLISVSQVAGHPVILIYTNAVAFSGSWTVTCRHK
jgi:hypothetical protein